MRKFAELAQRVFGRLRKHQGLVALVLVTGVLLLPKLLHAAPVSLATFIQNPFDSTALMLASVINSLAAVVAKTMLVVLEMIIVPILGYNGFSSADIVDLGWSLVRDVVNMGVVVILIVIAMQTIIGYSKANWTQQLPRLFIGVILVNFSRTICGVLIDISQVVMFTFVNAIIDIAAGNFAQMFGFSSFGSFNEAFIEGVNQRGTGIEAYMFLGSAYLQLALYLAIFSVVLLLALMYIWRIVVLWLLIIMSPVAFFLNGIGDMFKAASGYYGEWWKKFSGALIMGPLLTFFLWLALAAASGSNLAVTQDFPLPDEPGEYGLSLENFSLDSLLGTFVALILLVVGMQLASSSAGAIGGPVAKFISEDFGKKIAGAAVRYPAALAGRGMMAGAKFADKKIGQRIDADVRTGTKRGSLTSHLGAAGIQLGQSVSDIPVVGGAAGAFVAGLGGSVIAANKAATAEKRKKAQETVKGMDSEHRNTLIADMAADGKMFGALKPEQQEALRVSMATDLKAQKAAEEDLKRRYGDVEGKKRYEQLLGDSMEVVEKNKDDWLDATGKEALVGTMTANVHLLREKKTTKKQADGTYKEESKSSAEVKAEFIKDEQDKGGFKIRLMKGDAVKDDEVKRALETENISRNGKNITLLEDIGLGTYGKELMNASLGVSKAPSPINKDVFTIPNASSIPATATPEARAAALQAITDRQGEVGKNVRNVVANNGVRGLNDEALAEFKSALGALPPESISHVTRVSADEQLLKRGTAASEVYGAAGAAVSPTTQLRMTDLMERDPNNAQYLSDHLDASLAASGGDANVVTEAIADGIKVDNIKKLRANFDRAEGPEKEKLRKTVATIEKAVDAELVYQQRERVRGGESAVDKEYEKKLKNTKRAIKLLSVRSGGP